MLTSFRAVFEVIMHACLIALLLALACHAKGLTFIKVETNRILQLVSESFLSFSLDTHTARKRNWCHFNFSQATLLAKHLSPAHLRFGGTDADLLIFDDGSEEQKVNLAATNYDVCNDSLESAKDLSNFTLTGGQLQQLSRFAKESNLRLLFDLNALLRNIDSSWSSFNAEKLLRFAQRHGVTMDFELGNEPNAYNYNFNRSVSATQLAKDYGQLKRLLQHFSAFRGSMIVGPAVSRVGRKPNLDYLDSFLQARSTSPVNAVTFHSYYINGRNATLKDFINATILDNLKTEVERVQSIVRRHCLQATSLWLGETGSAYGSGAYNLSDTYVAGFMWLDKLGVASEQGVNVIVRQSLFHGHYALLDNDLNPNPDYWLSLIYKKIVGKRVLRTMLSGKMTHTTRFYASCSKQHRGRVVAYGMNLAQKSITVKFSQVHFVWKYLLEPGEADELQSKYIVDENQQLVVKTCKFCMSRKTTFNVAQLSVIVVLRALLASNNSNSPRSVWMPNVLILLCGCWVIADF